MSNITRIPKWAPQTSSVRKFQSQFARRKPYTADKTYDPNARNSRAHSSRNQEPAEPQAAPPKYYGTHSVGRRYNEDMRIQNRDRITKDRVTRLGVFRNGCGSEVISNNVSTRVQKKVDRRIRQLIEPEEDVEWTRRPETSNISSSTVDRPGRNVRENQNDLIDKVRAMENSSNSNDITGSPHTGRFSRYEQYQTLESTSISRNNSIQQSFNETDNNDNSTSITATIPSTQLARRLFSGFSDLPLHEAGELLNAGALQVLGNGLKQAINPMPRSRNKEVLENRAMSCLLNRTRRLVTTSDRSNCTVPEERSDYLFPISPQMFETSAPCTPSIERAFNNTMHCALDTELEVTSMERDDLQMNIGKALPSNSAVSPFFMMANNGSPISETEIQFESYVPDAFISDYTSPF